MISECEGYVKKSDEVNFLQNVNLENEKKKIVSRIMDNKSSMFVSSQTSSNIGGLKSNKPKVTSKITDNKSQKIYIDKLKKGKPSPVNLKNPSNYSAQRPVAVNPPKDYSPKRTEQVEAKKIKQSYGTEMKEKSDCSKSNFHLSILKSEKVSYDAQTKKSYVTHNLENNFTTNIPRNQMATIQSYHKFGKSDNLEDQIKQTVFKNGPNSNINSLYSRKF